MILIDSLYINNSGGLRLLLYLVKELLRRDADFFLLADSRCQGKFDMCKNLRYMKASLWNRARFYRNDAHDFSSVLCFGNIPPQVKLDVPVYTYFHNINLLTVNEAKNAWAGMVMRAKRGVFKHYKENTDYWLVQTSNTSNELVKHLGERLERVQLMPFYELPPELGELAGAKHGDDYVFVSAYTGAKGHEELLDAWRLLHQRGVDRRLHLTVPPENAEFCSKIKAAQKEGVDVVNHGLVPFGQIIELYRQSKAAVYPSHNESLGLGLVEAITAGCDVIASDLPYTYSVCEPSLTFDPYSPESIAQSIEMFEKGNGRQSRLLVRNHIEELTDVLMQPRHIAGGGYSHLIFTPLRLDYGRVA